MDCETIQQCINPARWIDYTTAFAMTAAIVAAACAFLSYRLSKNIYDEIKSDEVIISGPLHHPGLDEKAHNDCVLRCTLFNKSRKKAYISGVKAFDQNGAQIPITWSNSIDKLGNIQKPTGLMGLENSVELVLRRNDGMAFIESTVHIKHSFSDQVIELAFDPLQDWW